MQEPLLSVDKGMSYYKNLNKELKSENSGCFTCHGYRLLSILLVVFMHCVEVYQMNLSLVKRDKTFGLIIAPHS